jgi:sulfotransferase
MEQIHLISGLPRAGSTLLCQILDSNPEFHVTPTSGVLDMLKVIRSNFSQNPTWRAQNRLDIYENIRMGMKGFVEGFFFDKKIVFDKNRAWPSNINLLDTIMQDDKSKIIWLYRNPVEIVSSIEAQYQKTLLLENMDESSAPGAFLTLDRRIATYINPDGLISYPVEALKDALEMGYSNRILFIKYFDLTNNTKLVLDTIHDFLKIPRFDYDLKNN